MTHFAISVFNFNRLHCGRIKNEKMKERKPDIKIKIMEWIGQGNLI